MTTITHNVRPEVAPKLAAILRELPQTRGVLSRVDDDERQCYCFEGAVCELYRRETGFGAWVPDGDGVLAFLLHDRARRDCAHDQVLAWVTGRAENVQFHLDDWEDHAEDGWRDAMELNDGGDATFAGFAAMLDGGAE